MIGWEKRVLLRHHLVQGLTKAVIAERLGINRRTINRWISKGDLDRDVDATVPRYGPRPAVPTKLDPFKPIIETRLKALPELSAVRLLEEIRAAGYTGGYTQLKEYVRKIRPRETEAVVRFETPPGHQAQVDFADFRLPWGKRYALLVVLGYSRLLWLHFFARKDMVALLAGLEQAFAFFGGVPRELLFDQMHSVITKDERLDGRRLVHNAEFLRFSAHWSFTPRACRPYRAKTKGLDLPRFRGRVSDEVFKLSLSPGRGKLPPRSGGVEHSDARDRRLYVRIRNRLTRIRPATPLSERLDARS